MSSMFVRISLIATLLASTACSQESAKIELKGQNTYGRSGSSNYASNSAPVAQSTVQAASTESIGVSDLSAPSRTSAPAKIASAAPAKPASAKHASSQVASSDGQKINLWTGKPHFSDAQTSPTTSAKVQASSATAPNKSATKQVASAETAKPAKKATKVEASNFMWPVASHKVLSGFGPKGGGRVNDGINIASADGEPVWAAAEGEVVYAGNGLQGYGNMVLIKHPNGKTTAYAHMSRYTVDKYERVKQGDIIGYVGTTGNVKVPQLHFAIRDGKDPIDPSKYLSRNVASN